MCLSSTAIFYVKGTCDVTKKCQKLLKNAPLRSCAVVLAMHHHGSNTGNKGYR